MACRKNSPGDPCCCLAKPSLIPHIEYNGVDKIPSQWNAASVANCCPYVEWTVPAPDSGGVLLFAENNFDNACYTDEFCVKAYVNTIRFYFSKFSCNSDWWVAMVVNIAVSHGRVFYGACYSEAVGSVNLYREKFVPSIASGTTITFSASDHYDWTAGGACHERGSCPDVYSGEISTTSYYCCGTILDPNCGGEDNPNLVNPVTLDFIANEFSFYIP